MANDPQPAVVEPLSPPPPPPGLPLLRLGLAWGITLIVLPYAWGRALVFRLLTHQPEWPVLALLVVGVVTAVVLIAGRAPRAAFPRFHRWLFLGILIPWLVEGGVLVALRAGPLVPWYYVAPIFMVSTLWLPWFVWMFYVPIAWRTRLGVLALLVAVLVGSGLVLTVDGLTGASDVNFAWRWKPSAQRFADETALAAQPIDLTATAHDFAQFLGPERLAVLPSVRLASDWSQRPPRLVWRKPVGQGWSSFAVVGNYAITQEQRGERECVVCYRLDDGAPVWVHADKARFDTSLGGIGPRATPTIANGRVFTVGATGILNCLDGTTGQRIWSVNILEDNHAENISHGVCGSPLLVDDRVIVSPTGGEGPSLVAYRQADGQRVWQAGRQQASYSSPMLANVAGARQILLYTSEGVAAFDPVTGAASWDFPWTNSTKVNCSQPLPNAGAPNQVLVTTGYSKGAALIQVERADGGAWSVKPRWEKTDLKTKFTTAVIHRGYAYGLDEGILECVDLKTGKRRWKDGRYEHGQILLVGDLLLVQAENGQVVLVEPRPEGPRELGRLAALDGKTWNNPVVAGKFLLVRNDQEAACYELALTNE